MREKINAFRDESLTKMLHLLVFVVPGFHISKTSRRYWGVFLGGRRTQARGKLAAGEGAVTVEGTVMHSKLNYTVMF